MFCIPFGAFAIVWSPPLHKEEGSGTMLIPNSLCCVKVLISNQISDSKNITDYHVNDKSKTCETL